MTEQTIAQVGEFPLIDSLVAPLSMGPQVQLGPGDAVSYTHLTLPTNREV